MPESSKKAIPHVVEPAADGRRRKKITLEIPTEFSLDMSFLKDPHFRAKAMFLIVLVVLLVLTAVMFQRSNMHLSDMFDTPRFSYHLTKLWSPAFLLFLILYGAAMAVSAYYGMKLSWLPALFPLVVSLLVWAGLAAWMPAISQPTLALALSVGAASLIATRYERPKLSSAWSIAGLALVIFIFLALAFTFARVNANKDFYFDLMLSGATEIATGSSGQGAAGITGQALAPLVTAAIQNTQMDDAFFRGLLNRTDFQPLESNISSTCQQVSNVALVTSGVCQGILTQNYPIVANASGGAFSNMLYDAAIARLVQISPQLKRRMADQASQSMASLNLTPQSGQQAPALPAGSALRQQLLQSVRPLQIAYDYLPYLIALSVASALYLVTLLSRFVAALALWGLSKVV